MKNLNKENFWSELHSKYPDGVNAFCEWIDEYKKRVNWDTLFSCVPWSIVHNKPATSEDYKTHVRGQIKPYRFKFHDIPLEMQVGILEQFKREIYNTTAGEHPEHVLMMETYRFTAMFKELDEHIQRGKKL